MRTFKITKAIKRSEEEYTNSKRFLKLKKEYLENDKYIESKRKKALDQIKQRDQAEMNAIDEIYNSYFPDWTLTDRFKNGSLKTFLKILGIAKVEQAMHTACGRMYDDNKAIKYFCGICWNKIRDPDA